jgi:predicted nucleic acid-binding protein
MRIVIDTNVIISAIFFNGTPRRILEKWAEEKFELICSQEIIEEYIAERQRTMPINVTQPSLLEMILSYPSLF